MDFLGLRTLTDIKKATDYVYEQTGKKIDFTQCEYDDPEVFKTISSGDTMGIFQLESGGMKDLMHRMQPDGLEDIIAGISLYRPGPMQFIDNYIEGKRNKASITYLHPKMEQVLAITNGCIVYQEQVMQLVRLLAGFSVALADNVRYAMSKKKLDMMEKLGKLFIFGGTSDSGEVVPGCINNGISEEVAKQIYAQLDAFSQYAFNKSHATCYAYVCYQTAYLKHYHPVELLCAILNNRISNSDDIKKYTTYAKSKNIKILPPCINKSQADFTVDNGALRFGLGAIRNVGVAIVQKIVEERKNGEFASMQDLFERAGKSLNKRLIENMIKGGAFDCFGRTRADMLQWYQDEWETVQENNKKQADGQMSLFDMMPELKTVVAPKHDSVKELSKEVLYSFEKEVLGFYMSGSPLDDYPEYSQKFKFNFNTEEVTPIKTVDDYGNETEIVPVVERKFVTTGGILHDVRVVKGKDNRMMAFGVLEDYNATIEVGIYSDFYEKYKALFVEDAFVVIKGNLSEGREGYKISVREVINPKSTVNAVEQEESAEEKPVLWLKMDTRDDDLFDKIQSVLDGYTGENAVKLKMAGKVYNLKTTVRECPGVIYELEQLLGSGNAVFFRKTK